MEFIHSKTNSIAYAEKWGFRLLDTLHLASSPIAVAFITILGLLCGGISGAIARTKHRSFIIWFLVGAFLNFLGILICAVMPQKNKD